MINQWRWYAAAALLLAAAARAETVQVVVVELRNWTTAIVAQDDGTNPFNNVVPVSDCTSGSFGAILLSPGGSAIARRIGPLCGLKGGAGIYPVENPGYVESHLLFRDPVSGDGSVVVVPALRDPLTVRGARARIPLISNGGDWQTYVVVFGDPGPLTFDVFNGEGRRVGVEFVDSPQFLHPWPVLFYALKTPVDIGYVQVTEGDTSTPSRFIPHRTYYGFGTVAGADGHTQYVRTWAPDPE